ESGALKLENSTFALRDAVDGVVVTFLHKARSRSVQLDCTWDPDLPAMVSGDPQRLRQVLIHLLSHSLRHTPSGSVHMHVRHELNDPGKIAFAIQDTGVLEKAEDLGLSITRELVKLMGGELKFAST